MRSLFLPGPFADPRLVALLAGEGRAGRPTEISGFAVRLDPDTLRIVLAAQAETTATGSLIDADPEAAERIHFAMAAHGARPEAATTTDGERATVFVADDAPALSWASADAAEVLTATLAEATHEVLGHLGRRPAEAMPMLMLGIALRALARQRGGASRPPVGLRLGYGASDVEPIDARPAYAHYFAVEEHRLRHRRFDGAASRIVERAVLASGDAVTVLPYDPHRDTVLLIEQFRAGPFARRDPHPWCLETVAGRCGVLETPEATARREALEEAGLTLGRIERVHGYYSSPGMAAEFITSFVGEADLSGGAGVHGLDAEDEDIRSIVVPLAAALAAVESGEANTAPLLISLLWLAVNRERLIAAWTAG